MSTSPKTVRVPSDSELSLTLQAARESGEPVVVDTGEDRYTLIVAMSEAPHDIFADYDPQAAIAGLRTSRGALAGVDTEELLRDVYAQRAQDSRGRPA